MSFSSKSPSLFLSSRSATPSSQKQPAPKASGLDAPLVPDLPIPAETHMEHGDHDDDYFLDEEGFECSQPAAFHATEQSLTALPSMDKSPEKLRPSQDSGFAVNLDKRPPPPPSKRIFGFLREKHAAPSDNATTTSTDAPTACRGRRVMTSMGGGLRALRLLTRSHADLRKESSRAASSSSHLPVSVPACEASQLACASDVELLSVSPAPSPYAPSASEQFLQFPLPPGYKAESPEDMRVRASLEEELEQEIVPAAAHEEDPLILDALSSFGRSSLSLPRTRGRQQQQQANLDARSRSPSTETVIRHPRVSSTETVVRAARRASIPARLPLSPVVMGQPVVAARPSPAVGVPSAADVCRSRRKGSINFSRPFAVERQGAVGGGGEERSEGVKVKEEEECVGLAISVGPSPVKPLQHQQLASFTGDGEALVDDVPAHWPLRKMRSFVGSASSEKPLPALPEEDKE